MGVFTRICYDFTTVSLIIAQRLLLLRSDNSRYLCTRVACDIFFRHYLVSFGVRSGLMLLDVAGVIMDMVRMDMVRPSGLPVSTPVLTSDYCL